jgi:predicted transcriptional regulator
LKTEHNEIEVTLRLMEMTAHLPETPLDAVRTFGETLQAVQSVMSGTLKICEKAAIDPKETVFDDYIICLEDGEKVRMLRSYLRRFNLTPDTYRQRWGLPKDYPMVAPSFSRRRAEISKKTQTNLKVQRGRHNG